MTVDSPYQPGLSPYGLRTCIRREIHFCFLSHCYLGLLSHAAKAGLKGYMYQTYNHILFDVAEVTFLCVCVFLGLHLQHTEVSRLVVELELQLPAYATATATQAEPCL